MKRASVVLCAVALSLAATATASSAPAGHTGKTQTSLRDAWFTESTFSVRLVDRYATGIDGKVVTLAFPADEFGAAVEVCSAKTATQPAPPRDPLAAPGRPQAGTMVCTFGAEVAARSFLSAMEYRFAGDAVYAPAAGWKSGAGCSPEGYPTPDGPACLPVP